MMMKAILEHRRGFVMRRKDFWNLVRSFIFVHLCRISAFLIDNQGAH